MNAGKLPLARESGQGEGGGQAPGVEKEGIPALQKFAWAMPVPVDSSNLGIHSQRSGYNSLD
jgi:hypothetical protein